MARTKTRPVGRTPVKRRACEVWLEKELAGRPGLARKMLEAGAKFGWGWATVRRAKENVGAKSFKQGNEWWWFDPKTYTPTHAPTRLVAKNSTAKILPKITETTGAVEELKLQQRAATVADEGKGFESPKRTTDGVNDSSVFLEDGRKGFASSTPPQTREPEKPKPIEPLKPRRVRIWENEAKEIREVLISAAGFTDLYIMRADIRLRQEQLHSKGLLKEEAALNDLLSRINEALEKKKKDEKIEVNQ